MSKISDLNRIYIDKINDNHVILERLHKYYYKETKHTLFFSESGIFSLNKDGLYKHNIIDGNIIKRNNYYNDYSLWTDTTKIVKNNEIQQLPYNYVIKKIKELHFRLHENATITFCIQLSDNKITEYFFLTNEDIDNFSIKKDIVTFLSLLK